MREHCLSEFKFHDPYMKQKQVENMHALELLQDRLTALADLPFDQLQEQLALGKYNDTKVSAICNPKLNQAFAGFGGLF